MDIDFIVRTNRISIPDLFSKILLYTKRLFVFLSLFIFSIPGKKIELTTVNYLISFSFLIYALSFFLGTKLLLMKENNQAVHRNKNSSLTFKILNIYAYTPSTNFVPSVLTQDKTKY